jgi:hypothetical protein
MEVCWRNGSNTTSSSTYSRLPQPTASFSTFYHTQFNMQFSVISLVAVLAATASAAYTPINGTSPVYPTGTGAAKPSLTGTAAPVKPTSAILFTGAAARPVQVAGSALGFIVAGGVALVSFFCSKSQGELLLTISQML